MELKKKINNISKNKDAKVLISNFGYLTALQIASYIFPLITIPYLAHTIGVESFGKIAFAAAVIVWFETIADWGFYYTATRDVAKNRDDKKKISEIFSNVIWAKIFLMVVSFLVLLLTILVIPKFRENYLVIIITFLLIPGKIMFPDWFFQAMERMKYITILNVLSKLFFTIAIFIFIKDKSDFILQPLFISLGFLLSGFVAMYIILVKWGFKLQKPKFSVILLTLKNSTDVFINTIMPNFYNNLSVIILGVYGGNVANGIFDAGSKFVKLSSQFMNIVSITFFPFLSRKVNKHNVYVKINIFLATVFTVVLFVFAPLIIKLFFTSEFYSAILILRIMSFSIFFMALGNIYGTNYMIIRGYEDRLRNITLICSVIGLILVFPLIYFYNVIGAAIVITFTRMLLGIIIMIEAKRIERKWKIKS